MSTPSSPPTWEALKDQSQQIRMNATRAMRQLQQLRHSLQLIRTNYENEEVQTGSIDLQLVANELDPDLQVVIQSATELIQLYSLLLKTRKPSLYENARRICAKYSILPDYQDIPNNCFLSMRLWINPTRGDTSTNPPTPACWMLYVFLGMGEALLNYTHPAINLAAPPDNPWYFAILIPPTRFLDVEACGGGDYFVLQLRLPGGLHDPPRDEVAEKLWLDE